MLRLKRFTLLLVPASLLLSCGGGDDETVQVDPVEASSPAATDPTVSESPTSDGTCRNPSGGTFLQWTDEDQGFPSPVEAAEEGLKDFLSTEGASLLEARVEGQTVIFAVVEGGRWVAEARVDEYALGFLMASFVECN